MGMKETHSYRKETVLILNPNKSPQKINSINNLQMFRQFSKFKQHNKANEYVRQIFTNYM